MMIMGRPSYFIILYCSLSISYVLTIVSQISLVEGLYIVRAQIHGYRNPYQYRLLGCSSTRCQAICCDSNIMRQCISGERQCDTFFIFCLRPLGTSGYGCSSLNNDSVTVSDVNLNDAAIDFSNSTFLGLSNPLVLQGSTNVWNVSHSIISVIRYY